MDFKQVQSIIKNFENSSMTNLEIETSEIKIKLSKLNEKTSTMVETLKPEAKDDNRPQGVEVKSPLVGTFYESDTPNGKPFVQVGDTVKEGDTLCIIEAMKIMNEITSPINGTVAAINVKNGAPVGFDQVLMIIR
jgi:acetyl-CoA carboxylase biotin carboxyl carrier protein